MNSSHSPRASRAPQATALFTPRATTAPFVARTITVPNGQTGLRRASAMASRMARSCSGIEMAGWFGAAAASCSALQQAMPPIEPKRVRLDTMIVSLPRAVSRDAGP